MKFKKSEEVIACTNDLYYDLFEGGNLTPDQFLDNEEDIKKVEEAIKTINSFLDGAIDLNLIEVI